MQVTVNNSECFVKINFWFLCPKKLHPIWDLIANGLLLSKWLGQLTTKPLISRWWTTQAVIHQSTIRWAFRMMRNASCRSCAQRIFWERYAEASTGNHQTKRFLVHKHRRCALYVVLLQVFSLRKKWFFSNKVRKLTGYAFLIDG